MTSARCTSSVGHYIFKELIERHHPTETTQCKATSFNPTYEGIRYAAGWVARVLRKELKRSAHPLKDDLSLCIVDLLDDKDDSTQESNEWVEAVDCGGLTRVNNITLLDEREDPERHYCLYHGFQKNV